ncbi:MAG: YigZ family protein, partial [Cocleimonas sp.]|nr:YigZ family protein [Cocleimonas sp.]
NVIEHSGVGDISVVVVRYFGGIKLGTGGLVRAYSSSVSEAMKQAEFITKITMQELVLSFPYAEEAQVRYLVADVHGKVLNVEYSEFVTLSCHLPIQEIDSFEQRLGLDIITRRRE